MLGGGIVHNFVRCDYTRGRVAKKHVKIVSVVLIHEEWYDGRCPLSN